MNATDPPASTSVEARAAPLEPEPPVWFRRWIKVREAISRPLAHAEGTLAMELGNSHSGLRADIDNVDDMSDGRLAAAVETAYSEIRQELARARRHPIRFWNFVPGIRARADTVPERYMIFNVGRFRAFESWFGPGQASAGSLPASSAVGVVGRHLTIHCLAAPAPGRHVENPRQTPAYRYSERYGPLPPSFSRATATAAPDGRTHLLVAGTASVVGEETAHQGEVEAHTLETLQNLAGVLRTGCGPRDADPESATEWLDRFRSVRVHLPDGRDVSRVAPLIESHFRRASQVEFCEADLCRRDLLIEIEGVASLDDWPCDGSTTRP